jgi:hypothetical protein
VRDSYITGHIYLPCGGEAEFDEGSGCSHRCMDCNATVGSIGMPRSCKEQIDKYEKVLPALGSKVKWDYRKGCEFDELRSD